MISSALSHLLFLRLSASFLSSALVAHSNPTFSSSLASSVLVSNPALILDQSLFNSVLVSIPVLIVSNHFLALAVVFTCFFSAVSSLYGLSRSSISCVILSLLDLAASTTFSATALGRSSKLFIPYDSKIASSALVLATPKFSGTTLPSHGLVASDHFSISLMKSDISGLGSSILYTGLASDSNTSSPSIFTFLSLPSITIPDSNTQSSEISPFFRVLLLNISVPCLLASLNLALSSALFSCIAASLASCAVCFSALLSFCSVAFCHSGVGSLGVPSGAVGLVVGLSLIPLYHPGILYHFICLLSSMNSLANVLFLSLAFLIYLSIIFEVHALTNPLTNQDTSPVSSLANDPATSVQP